MQNKKVQIVPGLLATIVGPLSKQRWKDIINADMRAVGAKEEDVEDRDTWKALVSAAATPY